MHERCTVPAGFLIALVILSGCTSTAPISPASGPSKSLVPVTTLLTGGFALQVNTISTSSTVLSDTYTCAGGSESPQVSWANIPQGTKSLALILDDPDASSGMFNHWLVYNIPPKIHRLDRAQPAVKVLSIGAQQGQNSAGSRGYFPPCPPIGSTHRYIFRLYALDTEIPMPTADRDGILLAIAGHVIGETEVVTTFSR